MTEVLLPDWRSALENAEIEHVQQLLDIDPTLLWQPLSFNEVDYPRTMSHIKDTSHQYFKDLTVAPIYAIQLLIITLFEKSLSSESDEAKLLSFLIGFATADDLNTCFWGSTKSTTLHLANSLGQSTTSQQLLDRGASEDILNHGDYVAKDDTYTKHDMVPMDSANDNNGDSNTGGTNSSTTINRFKQLRQIAEDGGPTTASTLSPTANLATKRQNSTRRYFQPGHLEERRRKVLQEEKQNTKSEHEDKITLNNRGRTDTRRQQEVESLAKQSRVRNNPLLKKFQEQHQQERSLLPATSLSAIARRKFLEPELEKSNDRRISKGITSLKDNSFVSASVFRRQQHDTLNENDTSQSDPMIQPSDLSKQIRHDTPSTTINDESSTNNDNEPPSPLNTSQLASFNHIPPKEKTVPDHNVENVGERHDFENLSTKADEINENTAEDPTPSTPTISAEVEDRHDIKNLSTKADEINENTAENSTPSSTSISAEVEDRHDIENLSTKADEINENTAKDSTPSHLSISAEVEDRHDIENLSTKADEINKNTAEDMTSNNPTVPTEVEDWQGTEKYPLTRHSAHLSRTRKSRQSLASDSESEHWFDSYEEYAENEARKSAILLNNMQRQSLLKQSVEQKLTTNKDNNQIFTSDLDDQHLFTISDTNTKETCTPTISTDSTYRSSHETEDSQENIKFKSPGMSEDESVNTWTPPSPKSYTGDYKETALPPVPSLPDKIDTPKVTQIAIEEPPVQQQTKKGPTAHQIKAIDTSIVVRRVSLGHKTNDVPANILPPKQDNHNNIEQQQLQQQERSMATQQVQSLADNKPHPILPLIPETASSGYGKIYIRMTQAHDILLPLPVETTYVRCIISDGRQEHVSRYEVLANKVQFQYECTLDTYPSMIVSVALQVRPDPHVRPPTGLLNRLLFTSAYRQKKSLPGYVHPEDYIIGQARFALEDMTHVCNQKSYSASFDCFNSWFVQSTKERRRATASKGEQIIKVVGQLGVDMLYLPVSDPSMTIPNSLQECDLALRIRQWHGTCWCRGYLSTRQKYDKIWHRQYFRLVGSRLLGFDTAEDGTNFVCCYDITDAVQLIVAAEQVLVDTENFNNTPQQNQPIFSQNSICEDNRKGFFRITFSNGSHIDCVSDHSYDSEVWVRTLRAMIGRVPLTVSAAVFLE